MKSTLTRLKSAFLITMLVANGNAFADDTAAANASSSAADPSTSRLQELDDSELVKATAQFVDPGELQSQIDSHDIPLEMDKLNARPDKAQFPPYVRVEYSNHRQSFDYSSDSSSMK